MCRSSLINCAVVRILTFTKHTTGIQNKFNWIEQSARGRYICMHLLWMSIITVWHILIGWVGAVLYRLRLLPPIFVFKYFQFLFFLSMGCGCLLTDRVTIILSIPWACIPRFLNKCNTNKNITNTGHEHIFTFTAEHLSNSYFYNAN